MRFLTKFVALFLTIPFTQLAFAQHPSDAEQPLPPFGGFSGNDFDVAVLQNGSLHITIPLVSHGQRGGKIIAYRYLFDTPAFRKHYTKVRTTLAVGIIADNTFTGWYASSSFGDTAASSPTTVTVTCTAGSEIYTNRSIIDEARVIHETDLWSHSGTCGFATVASGPALDGSGMALDVTNNIDYFKNGNVLSTVTSQIEDPNGNLMTPTADTLNRADLTTVSGPNVTFTTPLGKTTSSSPQYILQQYNDSNGATQTLRVDYEGIDIHTGLCGGLTNCIDQNTTKVVPSKLTLPDGATYQFTWVNNSLGQLQQIVLPTGGSISYTYGSSPLCLFSGYPNESVGITDQLCREAVATRTVSTSGASGIWTYAYGSGGPNPLTQVTETDAMNNDTVHFFSTVVSPAGQQSVSEVETEVQYFQGTGSSRKLLKQIVKTYASDNSPIDETPINIRVTQVDTTLDNGLVSRVQTDYETFQAYACTPYSTGSTGVSCGNFTASRGNPTEVREYDYGQGAPGPLLRRTDYTYLHNSNSAYAAFNVNIVDRVLSKTVYNGAGTLVAQTNYEYDVYNHSGLPAMGASGAVQHDSAKGTSYTLRGNQTGVSKWVNTSSSWLTTNNQFDDAGNIIATKDPRGNVTNFDYSDSWISIAGTTGGSACAPSGQGKAYLTKLTNALSQVTTHSYYSCSGSLGSTTDPNNLTSWNVYDLLGRTVQAHAPDGGLTTNCFTDMGGSGCQPSAPPFQQVTTKSINATLNEVTTAVSDGLGRVVQTQLNSDPQGTVITDKTYDALGRVATVSNPYRAGSDPTSSPGTTTYIHDALGRKCVEVPPDGSAVSGNACPASAPAKDLFTLYSGPTTTVTDQTGRKRQSTTDALGRLTQIVEDPGGLGYVTNYTVDTLGNLTQVIQNGSHTRTFTYDSLSRLLTSANPETGTITYKYDSDANCGSPNSFPSLLVSKTDARAIRTCAQYDPLNRQTVLNYSNGDPTVATTYDGTNCLGLSTCQNTGQRTSMTDAAGSEAWSYQVDATNHRSVHVNQRTTSGISKTSTYYLDFAGNVTQAAYPTGRVVNYTYDAADRPKSATDGSNGITYATDFQTAPTGCLSGAVCYTPQGTFYTPPLDRRRASLASTLRTLTTIASSRMNSKLLLPAATPSTLAITLWTRCPAGTPATCTA